MQVLSLSLLVIWPLVLVIIGILPDRWANSWGVSIPRLGSKLTGLSFCFALASGFLLFLSGASSLEISSQPSPVADFLGVYFDSLSAVLLLLICFVGHIIARYTVRYLDGDPNQDRFVRGMLFTLGAVQLLVVSHNLVMFFICWVLTSVGLHRLLTHFRERPGAIRTARTKFFVSRVGDLFLLSAIVFIYREYGVLSFSELLDHPLTGHSGTWNGELAGLLLALGAMTKSAQIPWHGWLPETMEAPTPLSALMHAGIINAGGFLVIRLNPLITDSFLASSSLVLIGGVTAAFGALVMMTQPAIKRMLAYSTIAQMGFMMLQCGLGAYAAALLHIVAHSLYKTHAFLSCGSVVNSASRSDTPKTSELGRLSGWQAIAIALFVAAGIYAGVSRLPLLLEMESDPLPWPLMAMTVLAMAQLIWTGLNTQAVTTFFTAVITAGIAVLASISLHGIFAEFLPTSATDTPSSQILSYLSVMAITAIGMLGLISQAISTGSSRASSLYPRLYVHACNGFYLNCVTSRFSNALIRGFGLKQ